MLGEGRQETEEILGEVHYEYTVLKLNGLLPELQREKLGSFVGKLRPGYGCDHLTYIHPRKDGLWDVSPSDESRLAHQEVGEHRNPDGVLVDLVDCASTIHSFTWYPFSPTATIS